MRKLRDDGAAEGAAARFDVCIRIAMQIVAFGNNNKGVKKYLEEAAHLFPYLDGREKKLKAFWDAVLCLLRDDTTLQALTDKKMQDILMTTRTGVDHFIRAYIKANNLLRLLFLNRLGEAEEQCVMIGAEARHQFRCIEELLDRPGARAVSDSTSQATLLQFVWLLDVVARVFFQLFLKTLNGQYLQLARSFALSLHRCVARLSIVTMQQGREYDPEVPVWLYRTECILWRSEFTLMWAARFTGNEHMIAQLEPRLGCCERNYDEMASNYRQLRLFHDTHLALGWLYLGSLKAYENGDFEKAFKMVIRAGVMGWWDGLNPNNRQSDYFFPCLGEILFVMTISLKEILADHCNIVVIMSEMVKTLVSETRFWRGVMKNHMQNYPLVFKKPSNPAIEDKANRLLQGGGLFLLNLGACSIPDRMKMMAERMETKPESLFGNPEMDLRTLEERCGTFRRPRLTQTPINCQSMFDSVFNGS